MTSIRIMLLGISFMVFGSSVFDASSITVFGFLLSIIGFIFGISGEKKSGE